MSGRLTEEQLATALRCIDDEYQLDNSAVINRGRSRLYRLCVSRETTETLVFKAVPEGEPDDPGIAADARLLALLGEKTSIPVPELHGVIDEHPTVPSPSFVMSDCPGDVVPYEAIGRMGDEPLRTLARQMGRYLGELHGVDLLDGYGHVRPAERRKLRGGLPDEPGALLTTSDVGSWQTFLERWSERELNRLAESRFESLTTELRSWIETYRGAYRDQTGPVLGRNDHGLHNLLIDRDTGEVQAMLDWAYTLGVAPAFDFEYAVYLYSGAFLAGLPTVEDRRKLVRTAMVEGYHSTTPELAASASDPHSLYELLAMMRIMNDFELLDLPDGSRDRVATRIRSDVRAVLEREGTPPGQSGESSE